MSCDGPAAKMIFALPSPACFRAVAMARLEERTHAHSTVSHPASLNVSAYAVKFTLPRGTIVLSQACSPLTVNAEEVGVGLLEPLRTIQRRTGDRNNGLGEVGRGQREEPAEFGD